MLALPILLFSELLCQENCKRQWGTERTSEWCINLCCFSSWPLSLTSQHVQAYSRLPVQFAHCHRSCNYGWITCHTPLEFTGDSLLFQYSHHVKRLHCVMCKETKTCNSCTHQLPVVHMVTRGRSQPPVCLAACLVLLLLLLMDSAHTHMLWLVPFWISVCPHELCMHECMWMWLCTYICLYVCMCVCVCVCAHVRTCMYSYIMLVCPHVINSWTVEMLQSPMSLTHPPYLTTTAHGNRLQVTSQLERAT